MHRLAFGFAFLSLAIAGCGAGNPADSAANERIEADEEPILGGTADNTNEATVFVYSQSQGEACSGTLIATNGSYGYILTAGHCKGMEWIVFGADYTTSNEGFMVDEDHVDPTYDDDPSHGHDFRILRFTGANSSMTVVPPASNPDGLATGTNVEISGFGLTSYPNGRTTKRMHVTVPIAQLDASFISYNQSGGEGACEGDSGGPAYATVNGQKRVVGVTSFGDQDCAQYGVSGRAELDYNSFIAPIINATVMETCESCSASALASGGACAGAASACLNDTECSALVKCLNGCGTGDQNCVNSCATQHPNGVSLYDDVFTCTHCQACSTLCPQDGCGATTGATSATASSTGASMAQSGSTSNGSGTTSSNGVGAGPSGVGAGGGAAGAGGSSSSDTPTNHDGTSDTSEDGGCAVAREAGAGGTGRALAGLVASLALIVSRRRRRGRR